MKTVKKVFAKTKINKTEARCFLALAIVIIAIIFSAAIGSVAG